MNLFYLFLADAVAFVVMPLLVWNVTRRVVPLAVLPILLGLGLGTLEYQLAFAKGELIAPSKIAEFLGWAGVMVLAFTAGLEAQSASHGSDRYDLHASGPRFRGARVYAIYATAVLALLFPFVVGTLAAYAVLLDLPGWRPAVGNRLEGSLAIGLCLAVSALPVLIGIVRELPQLPRVYRSLGRLSLRIAVIDDAALWMGLGALLVLVRSSNAGTNWSWVDGIAVLGLVALVLASRVLNRSWMSSGPVIAWPFGVLYLAAGAWATSVLGLHALLGCYLAGAMLPAAAARVLPAERLGFFALTALAPFFFGHRGLGVDGSVFGWVPFAVAFGLLALTTTTKIAAVVAVPPSPELSRRESMALGCLLQCKGLMEIVAATILRDAGILSEMAYAVLVTLAILSTAVTAPMFKRVLRASETLKPATKAP